MESFKYDKLVIDGVAYRLEDLKQKKIGINEDNTADNHQKVIKPRLRKKYQKLAENEINSDTLEEQSDHERRNQRKNRKIKIIRLVFAHVMKER